MSHTTIARRLVSSSNCFTYRRSFRPRIFQSTYRSSSPGWYMRCSANSTEKPRRGDRCSAGEKAFDDTLGDHLDPAEPGDIERIEEVESGGPWSWDGYAAQRIGVPESGATSILPAGTLSGHGDERHASRTLLRFPQRFICTYLNPLPPPGTPLCTSAVDTPRRAGGNMYVTLGWVLLAGLPLPQLHTIGARTLAAPRDPAAPGAGRGVDRPGRPLPPGRRRPGLSQRRRALSRRGLPGRHRRADPGALPSRAVGRHLRPPGPRVRGDRRAAAAARSSWMTTPASATCSPSPPSEPFDFRDITRGDYWDYRLIDGGRIQGDPYVALDRPRRPSRPGRGLRLRRQPVLRRPALRLSSLRLLRLPCLRQYDEWDPYRRACARFRVVIHDDPRVLPLSLRCGRNIVVARPAQPGPRFVFRDADPGDPTT